VSPKGPGLALGYIPFIDILKPYNISVFLEKEKGAHRAAPYCNWKTLLLTIQRLFTS